MSSFHDSLRRQIDKARPATKSKPVASKRKTKKVADTAPTDD